MCVWRFPEDLLSVNALLANDPSVIILFSQVVTQDGVVDNRIANRSGYIHRPYIR